MEAETWHSSAMRSVCLFNNPQAQKINMGYWGAAMRSYLSGLEINDDVSVLTWASFRVSPLRRRREIQFVSLL